MICPQGHESNNPPRLDVYNRALEASLLIRAIDGSRVITVEAHICQECGTVFVAPQDLKWPVPSHKDGAHTSKCDENGECYE